ncbi:PREDICTED: titin isoform X9 [Trachymyrmex septentrionalis]|uniref:titin isoform X9 n=1 Tax=Trachymyrmex septentrionalis TaxID=34720 RepID=UPI00084F710B|nr:PREDICTED: titin isoform X9 [Trachymyrmex septentrionalis]
MKRQQFQESQTQQQQQQAIVQEQQQQQQQYIQQRTERQVTRQQITSQQRVQGEVVMQTTPTVPVFTGKPGDPSPPIFERIFKNARFAQGGNAIFEGCVRGNPRPSVSWTHKGMPLLESRKIRMSYNENSGIVTLQINQIGPGDEGEYTCNAKNQYGEAICSVYIQPEGFGPPAQQLTDSYKKEFSQSFQTSDQKMQSGSQIFQQRSYQQITDKRSYINGTTTSIEDFKVDTFEYRLLRELEFRESITRRFANESDLQISTVVDRTLGPVAPPQITQKPRNSKIVEGSDAVFTAKITGNPKPRLTWFKNGQRIRDSQRLETSYSNQQATLRIRVALPEDSGHYTLLSENPQGCTVSSAYLAIESSDQVDQVPYQAHQREFIKTQQIDSINESVDSSKVLPPNFVRTITDKEATEGKMTRFDCRVTGRPYPEVTWYINDQQVANDMTHKILVNESGNNSLMITNVNRADAGVVTCIARNKAGETSCQCNLSVIEKEQVVAPKFVERFVTTGVKEGEPVIFMARAVGTPIPRITWQKDGVPITPCPEIRISSDGNGASTLDIPCAKFSDAAWYQCTAQNIAGSTATRARLFVETPKGTTPEPRRLNLPRPTKVIEPEPAPGPEVIYLRHVERAKPYLPPPEEDKIYPPPRFIIPLKDVHQIEGGRIHFEARIEPVGDPTMRVEWYVNGRTLDASSRATSVFRFGFISLDLISIVLQDSGEYLCRVVSSTGIADSRATLSVTPRATIEQASQHPDSLQYIQQLEDYSKYQRQESVEETSSQRPVFIRPLQDLGELQEGRNAHFEAQLTPVSDPTMKVEWYKDGKPITASSRITSIFNFGYVSLNIMHLRAEDAGSYTVRAVNRLGEAISSATLRVFARTSVTTDLGIPEQLRYIEAAEELEAYQQAMHQKYVQEQPEASSPPEFKSPIKDQSSIREGGFAHFEARLEPIGDADLRVEWLKDGRPVEASSRITTFFNFGYVALTIKYVTIHDVGVYTCRAYNRAGEAHTTAQLSVISKNDVIYDSQHPTGLQKIQSLEDSSRYSRQVQEETQITQAPRFLGNLKGTNKIVEGQRAHFEARVEPQSDLSMKIEWYHNGKPITAANRIQTYHDFGYVSIDILQVRPEDAGTYTVVARNSRGEARLSATMTVETRSSIDTSSMHRGTYEKTQRLEDSKFVEPQYHIEEISKSKPIFIQPLSDPKPVSEGKNIHLECRLEPMGDPTMRVEWFQNGRPVTVGSRFRTYYDFGFVALDIVHTTVYDSGEYTVRATNHLGTAHTSACVRIIGRSDIVTETQNEQSLEQIQILEDASRYRKTQHEDVTVMQAPQFTRPLHNIETVELTNVHLECRLQPIGDVTMKVDWFVNGRPVKTGHRFRPSYEFDYVALDILGVYPEDSGVYTCQARNQLGEAITSCSVRVHAKKDLLLESQHPEGLERIQYLEDASRYKRHELVDEVVIVKPKFITKPKNQENLREGQHAHFECKLEPVTDPNLKVEWFKNGHPVTIGHRFRPIHDFGYVALDVIDLIAEDSGTYTCRAVNLVGSDEVLCTLTCRSSAQILTDTQNELGLEQIHYLEDKSKYQRQEVIEETTTQAPIFTTSLNNVEIKEGQRAHFECRLIPVSDATMKIEWFHNNKPVKAGSRFIETNNFGFVALDIMYAYPEDSGTYTCRAKNIIGEAITSATAIVHSKKSIYTETQSEETLQRLRSLEDTSRYQRKATTEEIITQAPVFTMPIKDLRVAENQAAHFEARVIPVGDPKLKVEWLRNGVPISASNRVTTMHDFGYVALNMKYVNPEDSGTYTCRATNELGEAVTSATLFVQSKAALQFESQHEGALSKLQALEDTTKYQRHEEEEIVVKDKPSFTVQLNGPTSLVEGQSAHYECRIEPYPDPNMKVEWFHNGKPLSTGHRYRTTCDFGFASLDVLTVYAEDSGTYACQATNKLGSAKSSINLNVKSRASIIHDTQHESALKKIQYLEDDSRYKRVIEEDTIIAEKPTFGRPLKNIEHLPEGKNAHLEATLTPVNDPTMVVEWFRNGRPIPQGHKFKTTYDFGYVALDILYAYPEDSGTYMCKARNAVGEAITTCVISVDSKQGLCLDTLDAQRLQKIRELETVEVKEEIEKEVIHQKPVFLTPLNNLDHLKEGEHAHLECRVEPINDPNLKIEWFVNGVAIKTGHRFRTTHDFGYVALDILYTYPEDSGTYMCKATNLVGEAVNTCTIKVSSRRSILLDTQHPDGLEKIRELESQGHPARLEIEEPPVTPPRFVSELRGTTEVYEGQTAHFECQVEPLHDANLRIEFFHNGKPLPSAARFHVTFDFGYVALDIGHAVPEDAGQYSVRAINALGQCVSSIELKVIPRDNIILDSQRPEGMDKIRELEAQQPWKRPEIPEPQTRQRPVFTQPLQNIDNITEGHTAHFECRLIPVGDPMLKVEWFRNEVPLETSSRITKVHDFGYVSLDIAHVRDKDEGVYMCRASNPLGEAVTTASMKIKTKASIQLDTQHPEAQRRIAQLEAKEAGRPEEPEKMFDKPIFTQLLTGPTELWEGQMARYECRVVPVGDASLRFEWYMNGVELKMGSRFHVNHDFGYVTLDILKVIPEDSGVYTCKAINNAGEAISSISLKVKARSAIDSDSIQTDAWQKIQLKEAEMNKVPEMFVDTTPQQAPVFTKHLESFDKLIEGQRVYLEAQVEPRADPNLRVEWFKNGITLQTGTRLRSTFDFGLVTLSINGLRPDDSAIYTCKATNLLGEAVSTCSLKIADRHWLLGDTLHPDALSKIDALEQPQRISTDQPEPTYEEPVFITHLNNVECIEGDNAHFECNVEPSKDPTMKIEWFLNNKPLPTGARFKSTYDFGYVAMDLTHAYEEDSGVITVKATNSKGSAQTSGTLKCTSKQNIYLQTQHPQGEVGLEKVKEAEDAYLSKYRRPEEVPEHEYPKPIWTVPLGPEFKLGEAEPLHLEGQVEPKDDPNLKIEWYFNGKPLEHGSRFKMTSDFGFVTLDLTDVYERDSGIYTCKAYNKAGEAFTSTTVYCSTKENIIEKSQHPKGKEGLEAIQDLEESLKRQEGAPLGEEEGQPPMFTSQFENLTNLSEGEIAHFEASLIPTGDQTMVVEWFYNGKSLEASHRTRTVYAFGMVVLEVLGTKIEDSGTYTCRATNKWGKAEISVQLECIDKSKGQKPKFTTQIQSLEGLKDGQSAHFECTLIPVGDPHMKVEWFHNGKPLRHSSRFKMVSDFGFVVMDIAGVMSHDSGEYVCKASNKYGEDYTKATIKCFGKSGVYLDSLQPDSLARIRELESYTGEQTTTSTTPVAEPPKFITQIADITKLVEGQSAHFEARLTPVNDPDLKVEWYYNGKKLPHGHRYRTFHDFGIVILDILYCYEENSGVYECRAVNKYGEDSTRATLKCFSKTNLVLESQLPKGMEGGLEKIQNLEDSMIRTKDEKIVEERGKAPMFTVPLSNVDGLREGESAHFEARVIPTDDPKLKVEWFWNGKPLRTGSRFRTFCDFGFVILEISPIYPEDSGEYSCRATNDYGEAVTTCTMKCTGKRSIILESQLPKGMESTIDKIAELEGLGAASGQISLEDDTGRPPEFITTPSDLTLTENSLAHFECRLQPINDSSMRVEWFHNGKPLLAGSRVKTIHDFGFVILEVANCYQRDSGLYTCKATNRHGEATVSCKLQVRGRQGIILEPQLPNNFKTGTESIQKLEESLYKKDEILAEEETPNPPKFIVELKDIEVEEAGPSHFDCRVEPVGDPTMRIDWFHNGRPFATGSRVHQINDFGFISLDMSYTYARDSGEYVCRATNKWGSATTKATITCKSKKTIDFDSQLPMGMSGEKLKELERGPVSQAPAEEAPQQPPHFITQIQSTTVDEGEPVRFECRVEPKEDSNLRIEWYRNGKLIPAGHRYRTVYDMGFVSMDILYVYPEDSGEYVCKAINNLGEDTTRAAVSCKKLPSIILQNQVPKGMKKSEALMQMEATIKKYTSEIHLTEDDLYDADKKQPPRFVTQIQDQTDLVEMNSTKFECQLAPVGDPNMKVEWFFNGKPLPHKNRFTPIYDFGYVAMNFGWVYPEDSGEYLCRATNLYGMDETRAIIKTAGKPGIIYESQLPKGMKSIEKIREMEAAWQIVPEEEGEQEKVRSAPIFVSKPEPVIVEEGDCSRFCCRVTGYPRPRVMWIINGHTVVNGSRYKLTYDGMYHLDIPKTRQYDHGKVEVIARSSVGEARTETTLTVKQRSDDYRGVLKNSPRPWYDYGLTQYQTERQNTELERVFDERHQSVSQGIEIATEHLGTKVIKEPETEWQKSVKSKKNEDYYNKLMNLEEEQVLKETRLREASHQFAIPGDKVVAHSLAKGMAQKYEESLEEQPQQEPIQPPPKYVKKPFVTEVDIDTERVKATGKYPPEPSESTVHGREVHVAKQKQTQKEVKGDVEITRKITATETTEVEHKAKTQERVVQGQVKPAKPPIFTKKIQPCRAFEQEQAKFEVEFDGDPLPTIKWYREDFPIQNSADLQIYTFSTKSVLIIRQVFMEDSGVFSVIAENRGGKAKCSANLVVEERRRQPGRGGAIPPSFLSTIQSASVATGQLARFDAKITGTKPLDVYWLKNGKKIITDIRYKTLEEDNIYTLLILETVPEDIGKYECVAINSAGEARCEAECTVRGPQSPTKVAKPTTPTIEKAPTILEPLRDQTIKEGTSVAFACRIAGKPIPTIQWKKADKVIKPSKYFQMQKEGDFCTLRISEAFPEDEGVYKCIAKNSAGEVTTSANLRVLAPDTTDVLAKLTPLKDQIVIEGQPAQFKTQVSPAKPKPTIQWYREGALIPQSPDFQMIHEGSNAVLLIATTYEEDTGIFTCRATTSAGTVETSAKLIVKKRKEAYYAVPAETGASIEIDAKPHQDLKENIILRSLSLDKNDLPFEIQLQPGDESLPWRRGRVLPRTYDSLPWRKVQTASRDSSLDKLQAFESQIKPWTEEEVILKKAPKVTKDVTTERLEEVQLRPTKVEKKDIHGFNIELIKLKSVPKEATDKIIITEEYASDNITTELYKEQEDNTLLKTSRRLDETLSKKEKQEKPRLWSEEQIVLKKIKPKTKTTSELDVEKINFLEQEDTSLLSIVKDAEIQKLKKEKPITEKVEQPKPWTEEKIALKKAKPERKEIPKEILETVSLKPLQIVKKDLVESTLDKADLKPILKEEAEAISTITRIDVTTDKKERRASKDVDKTIIDKEDKTKPWTEEKIILKKSKPIQKEIEKEIIETVQLKSSKFIKPISPKPDLEKINLKPVIKETKNNREIDKTAEYVEQEDITLLQVSTEMYDDIKLKADTRKKLVREEKHIDEDITTYKEKEDITLLKVTSEHETNIHKKIKKQEDVPQEKPQSKTWMEEKIILKRTKPEQKEIYKETLEEVSLKPTSRSDKVILKKESIEKVDLKHIKIKSTDLTGVVQQENEPYHEEEDKIIIKMDEDIESTKKISSEKKSKSIPYTEKEDTTILDINRTDNIIEKYKKEGIPWVRGKKAGEKKEVEEIRTPQIIKPEVKLEEDKPTEISEAPWRRKPKSSIQKKISETETDKTKFDIKEVSKATWQKSEKSKTTKSIEEKAQIEDFTSVVLKPAKWHEKPKEQKMIQEITLHSAKQLPKEKEDLTHTPVRKEISKPETSPEKIDEINGDILTKKMDIPWRRAKKLTQTEQKPEDLQLKPIKKIIKPEEAQPEEVILKHVRKLPKEEESKDEIVLKPVQKETVEEKPEQVRLKPVKKMDKPEEPKPEKIVLKPVRKLPKDEESKEAITLKPVEKEKVEETLEEIRLKPVKKTEKPEEPKPEQVVLKPIKKLVKEDVSKEEITLKPVEKKKVEDIPEEIRLKPVKKIDKPEEPKPEQIVLKPVRKLPKDKESKEEITLKPTEKETVEETSEKIRLKPVTKMDKPEEPKPEQIVLKPVRKLPKDEETKEEITLKSIEKKKVEEIPEEIRLKPVTKMDKPEEPKPEQIVLKPVRKLPKDEETKEEITLKSIEKKKVEEIPEEIRLKPVTKMDKPEEPKPEQIVLKPVRKLPKDEETKEEITLKSIEKKKVEEIPEEIRLKPVTKMDKPEEPKPEQIVLKPVRKLPKDEETKEEITLKSIEKKKVEEIPEEIRLKPVTKMDKPEEPKPEQIVLKPVRKLPKDEETKEEITLKSIEKKKVEEIPEEIRLKPVTKMDKPEEPKPEQIVLKPVRKLPKDEETKEEITLKSIEKKKVEEIPEEIRLKPVTKMDKPEEPKPEQIVLKPVRKLPKDEETKEEITLKSIEKKKVEEIPEEIRLKPVTKMDKPEEPKPEQIVLKPVRKLPKDEETKEEITLKSIEKKKVEEIPEEIRLKPVTKMDKPEEPKPEQIVLKPVRKLPKDEETKEEITLKSIEKKKVEEIPEEIRLKPVTKMDKPEEPKPEQIVLKPVRKLPKDEETKEEITLKPIEKEKVGEKPEEVRLKPVKKIERPEEPKPEQVVLKSVKKLAKEEVSKEEITLKPAEKEELKDIKSQPVSEMLTEIIEEKPKSKQPIEIIETPWRRKRTKKVVDFKDEVTIVPIDQEESVIDVYEEKEAMIITNKDTQDLFEQKLETVPSFKEDKVTDEVITGEVSWRKNKQIHLKTKEEKEMVMLKSIGEVEKLDLKQPEGHVLAFIEDEKLPEETYEEDKVFELKSVKLAEQIAEISEEKDEIITESVVIKSKIKEKVSEKVASNIIDEEAVKLQIKADVTQVEDRKRKRRQRTQVDISITDKDKTIAPRFIQKLQPVIAELKKTAKFTCTLIGNPLPEISWYKNEQELHASEKYTMTIFETTATLEITNVKEEDAGMYSCRASNPAGVATSTVNLVIFEKEEEGIAPHFSTPIKPLMIEEHTPALLECIVTGMPIPEVKWYRDEKEVKPNERTELSFNPTTGEAKLKILEPMSEDETIYRVRAINKYGRAECRANLVISNIVKVSKPIVLRAPRITRPLSALIIERGKSLKLLADFDGIPKPEVKWFRNGIEITPTNKRKIDIYESTTELNIIEATNKDSGKYEIRVQNEVGEARSSSSVTVKERKDTMDEVKAPMFVEPIQPQLVAEGEVVIMETRVESYPAASFQWFHESKPLESTPQVRIVTQENRSILMVKEVTSEFAGNYTCRAENVGGSVTCTATVNLMEITWEEAIELISPTFVKRLSPIKVMDGESVNLTCVVEGKPTPRVEWYHNDMPIKEGKEITIIQDMEGVCSLAITEVFPEDAGEYTCRAVNPVGEAVCMSTLIVEAYEYVPDSEIASSIVATSLTTGQSGSEEDLLSPKETPIFDTDIEESVPEIIKKLPQLVPTKDGELTRLEVKVKGKPKPKGKWYKEGVEIVSSQEFQIEEFEDGTSVLTIAETFPDDTGEITFEAYNPLGVSTTTTYLSVEGILGTKEYRKPEWVTQMEEMQEALKATQAVPRFIQEITDVYTKEGDIALFECTYSGNPKPDVVWYKNDKLIMNTNNVKVRIFDKENRTTLTIKQTTKEDDATYVCKATNEIGMIVTKAKLNIDTTISESRLMPGDIKEEEKLDIKFKKQEEKPHKKKKIELKKAKEIKEKVKTERLKIEKEEIHEEKLIPKEQIEEKRTIDVEETQLLESTEFIEDKPEEVSRARRIVPIQEPIVTEAIASLKKIDDQKLREQIPKFEERAKQIVEEQESVVVSEITSEDIAPDFTIETKLDHAQVTSEILQKVAVSEAHVESNMQETKRTETRQKKIKKIKAEKIKEDITVKEIVERQKENIAREVDEIMEVLDATEFGPGESPLRELATIGYLVRQGVSVNEINECLYKTEIFPALKTPDAQNALVQLVERKGHGPLITQVLTEETTTDESFVAATVGFRAFMRMVELQHATVEEVIIHFAPEDFKPRAWEVTEISEVDTEQHATERVDIVRKMEVHFMERKDERKVTHIQDIREIKDV